MINVSYLTTEPLKEKSPKITFDKAGNYKVYFKDNVTKELIKFSYVENDNVAYGNRQWYTDWLIEVFDSNNNLIHTDVFDCTNKVVFIKMDAFGLGDNIAWMPYVEEFRKIHNCKIICSTFFNELFENNYKDIMFVKPNTHIANVYAQYYVGVNKKTDNNYFYSPCNYSDSILQKVACDILGLEYKEIKSNIVNTNGKNEFGDYVCLSEFSSSKIKDWNLENGWQNVVDFLNNNGLKVIVISKEKTKLKNVIDKTGNIGLLDRINDIKHAKLFIGVSSGLAWISWSVGTHVVMISDYTPPKHEFQSNITRIYSENCRRYIEEKELQHEIPLDLVMNGVRKCLFR